MVGWLVFQCSRHQLVDMGMFWNSFRYCGREKKTRFWSEKKWTAKYCRGQHQIGWVHNHPHSVLEHCVCLLHLFYSCGWGEKDVLLLFHAQNNKFFDQNEPQNISPDRVTEDNTRWFRCTNIHIVYWNIVFASYNFFVCMVEE